MASTYSNLKIQLMATGENSGTWGNVTNVNLGTAIEEAIAGSADVTFSSSNVTLTLTDTNATQTARNMRLNLTGTTGGARDLIVPAIEKMYVVNNGCADAVTVKVSGQTGVAVPAGKTMILFNNGTDVVDAVNHLSSLTLGTDLAVAQGGTGASDASGARTNLGLVIGTDVLAPNGSGASLTSLNASSISSGTLSEDRLGTLSVSKGGTALTTTPTNGQLLVGNGTGYTLATITAGTGITVTNGSGSITVASSSSGGLGITGTAGFTSSGNWTAPSGVNSVLAMVVGGGGGGGRAGYDPENGGIGAGSGGAGGVYYGQLTVTPGTNYAINVGSGGNAPSGGGNAGGSSAIGNICTANGGNGGQAAPGGASGNAGTSSTNAGTGYTGGAEGGTPLFGVGPTFPTYGSGGFQNNGWAGGGGVAGTASYPPGSIQNGGPGKRGFVLIVY